MLINVSPKENAIIQAVRQGACVDLHMFDVTTNQAARDILAPFVELLPDADQIHRQWRRGEYTRSVYGDIAPGQWLNMVVFVKGKATGMSRTTKEVES